MNDLQKAIAAALNSVEGIAMQSNQQAGLVEALQGLSDALILLDLADEPHEFVAAERAIIESARAALAAIKEKGNG